MFLGTYKVGFSGAGRIVLPRKLRAELRNTQEIILTKGLDGCVWGFEKEDWEKEAKRQLEIPLTEKKGRDLRRYIFSGAESVELDKQSRFVIPGALLSYAKVSLDCLIVGAGDHFEVWNPKIWEKNSTLEIND